MSEADVDVRPYMAGLDIQVLHIERVFFDELPAGFDVFAHQRGEDGLALGDVFEFAREQGRCRLRRDLYRLFADCTVLE
jgi:hypothetical protein